MSYASLDGNAAAGDLADVFAFDTTSTITTCAACGHTHPMAALRVYVDAPGTVMRCSACDAVQLRFVRGPATAWLDVRGVAMFAIPSATGIGLDGAPLPTALDAPTR